MARAANSFTTMLSWQVVTGHTFPIACIATGKPTEHACDCVILTVYMLHICAVGDGIDVVAVYATANAGSG